MNYRNFNQINQAISRNSHLFFDTFFPGGKYTNGSYLISNPTRTDKHPSFLISQTEGNSKDLATGQTNGDFIGTYAYSKGLTQFKAAMELAKWLGLDSSHAVPTNGKSGNGGGNGNSNGKNSKQPKIYKDPRNAWIWLSKEQGKRKPDSSWIYHDKQGNPYIIQTRFDLVMGKEFRPFQNTGSGWRMGISDIKNYPLYNLHQISKNPDYPILFVEGEKAVESAQHFFPDYLCTTILNGAQSTSKSDFSPVKGHRILIWPDNDESSIDYATSVYEHALSAGASDVQMIVVPKDKPQKWDAFNAYKDGITSEEIRGWDKLSAKQLQKLLKNKQQKRKQQKEGEAGSLVSVGPKGKLSLKYSSESSSIIANALRNKVKFDAVSENWFKYNGLYWEKITNKETFRIVNETVEPQAKPLGYSSHYIRDNIQFLESRLLTNEWDALNNHIPFKNGVLDLASGQFTLHSPDNNFTYCLPYNYEPQAKCPNFEAWLDEVTEKDSGKALIMQCVMAAVLRGMTHVQKYLELIGDGGTGKSTYLDLLMALVGSHNTVTTDLKNLEENRFEVARLYKKRLILVRDAHGYAGASTVLKQIVGQDTLRYEEKGKQASKEFRADGMLVIATNKALTSSDASSGMHRRRIPINFNVTVHDKTDKSIINLMQQEMPGIFNLIYKLDEPLIVDVLKNPGKFSKEVEKGQAEHLCETNYIAAWLEDNCIIRQGNPSYTNTLYDDYRVWCDLNGVTNPKPLSHFTKNIRDILRNQVLWVDYKSIISAKTEKDMHGAFVRGLSIRDVNSWQDLECSRPISNNPFTNQDNIEMLKAQENKNTEPF